MPDDRAAPPARDPGEGFLEFLGAGDSPSESGLPEWRRRLNRFCENWLFAFLVAFAIRHFGVELFRIPSASMEPMLFGDPGFLKGDFVAVDKLTPRFIPVRRWEPTVFQYPPPEVESTRGERARPAVDAFGNRVDDPVSRPLLCSNFVKRAIVLPGETFYIRNGDLYLRQPDGGFAIQAKPADLQEHLWMPVYAAGEQADYRPWTAAGGATIDPAGPADGLALAIPAAGEVVFDQPLRNLYLKPGPVAVRQRRAGGADTWTRLDGMAMTRPQFAWAATGETGNLWDLDRWDVKRLTSADVDDPANRGRELNEQMTEWVGDIRVSFVLDQVAERPRLRLAHCNPSSGELVQAYDLAIGADGWSVEGQGTAAGLRAQGGWPTGGPIGRRIDFDHIDGQVVLRIDGGEACRQPVPDVDGERTRPTVRWTGGGRLVLHALQVARDLHYCRKGFLTPAPNAHQAEALIAKALDQQGLDPESRDQQASGLRMPGMIRGQILGRPVEELTRAQISAAYGTGPDNPITAPADAYLMLGDNSPLSLDGREWGWVPSENLRGRAWLVIFPPWRWKVIR